MCGCNQQSESSAETEIAKARIATLFLNGLPASGKSEVRKFLEWLPERERLEKFGIGKMVHLDDYPFVHFMSRIDEELVKQKGTPVFFKSDGRGFIYEKEWIVLSNLLSNLYIRLSYIKTWRESQLVQMIETRTCAEYLFREIDIESAVAGLGQRLSTIDVATVSRVRSAIEDEVEEFYKTYSSQVATDNDLDDKTVVLEFSRGGPARSEFPLPKPLGYYSSYSTIDKLLRLSGTCAILYVEVTPEISRAKNEARGAAPTGADQKMISIAHCVPDYVMKHAYGVDDMKYMTSFGGSSAIPHVVLVNNGDVPVATVNNVTKDLTSFTHRPPHEWRPEETKALIDELSRAFSEIEPAFAK